MGVLGLRGSVTLRTFRDGCIARRIAGWSLVWRMQRFEKCHECRCLRRTQVLAIGWHVAASLDHLANELVLREPHGNTVQRRPSLPSRLTEGMAIAALFNLKDKCASPLERRCRIRWQNRKRGLIR